MKKHIIVIGGGMAGTAAAYHLKKKGYEVTIVEKNDRLGGRIHSITTDDATFEVGAGFITDFYTNVFAFLQESGLVEYLQIRKSKAAIVKQGKLRQVTSIASIFGSNLVPFYVKKQLLGEFIKLLLAWHMLDMRNLWKASALDKQSVSEALHNKKGQEFVDYLIQPLLDGYCYWSAEKISHTMLLLIFKAALLPHKTYILKCGLQRIPEIAAKDSRVLLSHMVTHIKRLSANEYEITVLANHKTKKLRANGIICATTATEVSKMLTLKSKQKEFFSAIHYSSTALVAKTYLLQQKLSNYAIAYPRKENEILGAVTIVSDTAHDDKKTVTLVKLYGSGKRGKELCEKKDDAIDAQLTKETTLIKALFATSLKPTFRYIQRWKEAIPEFDVGHFQRLHIFANGEIESKNDNIVFAGDYIGGPFIEGAFTSGMQAAERLDEKLKKIR